MPQLSSSQPPPHNVEKHDQGQQPDAADHCYPSSVSRGPSLGNTDRSNKKVLVVSLTWQQHIKKREPAR